MNLYFAIPFLPGGNLEWIVVLMAALMIFGSSLPEVALRAVAHVMRFRRAVSKMWRDTGLEDELRRVRRDIEMSIPREADFNVKEPAAKALQTNDARAAAERARETAERNARAGLPGEEVEDDAGVDPDAHRSGGFRLEPADGIVAAGDPISDPAVRDQTPGADRQEPMAYEVDHAEEGPPEFEPEFEADFKPEEPEEDLGGSHFGAGVKPPSKPS